MDSQQKKSQKKAAEEQKAEEEAVPPMLFEYALQKPTSDNKAMVTLDTIGSGVVRKGPITRAQAAVNCQRIEQTRRHQQAGNINRYEVPSDSYVTDPNTKAYYQRTPWFGTPLDELMADGQHLVLTEEVCVLYGKKQAYYLLEGGRQQAARRGVTQVSYLFNKDNNPEAITYEELTPLLASCILYALMMQTALHSMVGGKCRRVSDVGTHNLVFGPLPINTRDPFDAAPLYVVDPDSHADPKKQLAAENKDWDLDMDLDDFAKFINPRGDVVLVACLRKLMAKPSRKPWLRQLIEWLQEAIATEESLIESHDYPLGPDHELVKPLQVGQVDWFHGKKPPAKVSYAKDDQVQCSQASVFWWKRFVAYLSHHA